ncbi:hypothetical protein BJX66DRAFT_316383 [Aspergillus keveii]|uniref:Uncharacterized protein n=1 Tax=Aspergillus keveii TaxID=714993 RepID=A0ABR4FN62_9EURO
MTESPGVKLNQIYPSPSAETQTDVDIITVHGMDTKSPDTWIWKSQTPNESDVNWFSDENMLSSKVGAARIFTCDWPAKMLQQSDSLPKVLKEFARLLLDRIQNMPRPEASDSQTRGRPILFITSCLGGIILMEAFSLPITQEYLLSAQKSHSWCYFP